MHFIKYRLDEGGTIFHILQIIADQIGMTKQGGAVEAQAFVYTILRETAVESAFSDVTKISFIQNIFPAVQVEQKCSLENM